MTEMAIDQLPPDIQAKVAQADRDVPRPVDYFAATETKWVTLPDGVQRVEVKVFNEGERRSYLNKTNNEVKMNSRTKDLIMRSAVGDDLHALLETAIVDWEVQKGGNPLAFTTRALKEALDAWPPVVVDAVAKEVRDLNPWLNGQVEDLPALVEERDDLNRRIAELEQRAVKS